MRLPKNCIVRDGVVYVLRKSRKRGEDVNTGFDKVCVECALFQECDTSFAPCSIFGIRDIDNMNFIKKE